MESKASSNKMTVSRNKGILGQELLYIKNGDYIWSLQHKEEKLWGRCSIDEGQNWIDWIVLLSDYMGYFSFTIEGEKLHLSCKNSQGHLVYLCWHCEEVSIDILGIKYIDEERVTYQTILVDSSSVVHLIYITDNPLNEIWKIKYAFKNGPEWAMPEIIEEGLGQGQSQGAAALDHNDTIHLIYQVMDKGKFQFVYRDRHVDSKQWGDKIDITNSNRSNLYPCLVIDSKGTLHLTWVRSDGMNYRILYRRKTRGGWMVGGWQKERHLSEAGVNAYTPTIGVLADEVIVLWQQTEGIYQCSSFDEGKSFNEQILKTQYNKLIYKNLLTLDAYKKQGLNIMGTFDTGSTSVALLATVFQNEFTEDYNPNLNLPEVEQKQELILPNMEYLSLDYGQKDLEEHLKKINGNFKRLFFEAEDVRITNVQMKETIEEHTETIENLKYSLEDKDQELTKVKEQEKSMQSLIQILKDSLKETSIKNTAAEKEKLQLEKSIQSLAKEKELLEEKLDNLEELVQSLQNQLNNKDSELDEENKKHNKVKSLYEEKINEKQMLLNKMENSVISLQA
ncbi:MAG: hypothetical protein SCK28_14850, partial [Bacillota bacterium]|nr:hypothetical protein [Bacillota bacterium]